MISKNLTADLMRAALAELDSLLDRPVTLIVGGGGAMILAHGFPLSTTDIDAVPKGMELTDLAPQITAVAEKLDLPHDWLNPYFSTYAFTLPSDYGDRLITVFEGKHLRAHALSLNEMLIMKCYAHRQKDVGHAKALIRKGADTQAIERHIVALSKKGIPKSQAALDFLLDICDQLEE